MFSKRLTIVRKPCKNSSSEPGAGTFGDSVSVPVATIRFDSSISYIMHRARIPASDGARFKYFPLGISIVVSMVLRRRATVRLPIVEQIDSKESC
jgi:hypothetical protein